MSVLWTHKGEYYTEFQNLILQAYCQKIVLKLKPREIDKMVWAMNSEVFSLPIVVSKTSRILRS